MSEEYGFDFDNSVATVEGSNVANHMLRELMDAMGIDLSARSATPREVWYMAIRAATGSRERAEAAELEVKRLRDQPDEARRILERWTGIYPDDGLPGSVLYEARAFLAACSTPPTAENRRESQ